MDEEKRFDELLNSKLEEREFPFNELNWDEAERLIVKQEMWKKISRISLVFSAGLAAGVLIMLPFILGSHNTPAANNVTQVSTQQNTAQQTNIPAQPVQPAIASTNNASKIVQAPLPVQSAFVKKDNSTGIRSNSSNNKAHPASTPARQNANQPLIVAKKSSDKRVARAKIIKPEVSYTLTANSPDADMETVANAQSPETKNSSNSNSDNKTSNNNAANSTPVASNPVNANPSTNNNSNTNSVVNSITSVNSTPTKTSTPTNNNITSSKPKKDTIKSNENHQMLPGTKEEFGPVYTANIFSVFAGGNYSLGWNYDGTTEGSGITPLGGFSYTHYFSQKVSASIGAGYSELNKLDKTYTSSTVQYDFGQNADITKVMPQRIYYLAAPVKIQYNFNDKNMLSLGLDFLFLMTTSSTVTQYQLNDFGVETNTGSSMQNGYTQGFANMDIQFTLGYTRMITDRFGIRPEYYHGFVYIENSTFPGINQFERNNGFRLVLSYQLMK